MIDPHCVSRKLIIGVNRLSELFPYCHLNKLVCLAVCTQSCLRKLTRDFRYAQRLNDSGSLALWWFGRPQHKISGTVLRPKQLPTQVFGHSSACRWELYVWGRVSCVTDKGRQYNWIILSGLQSDVVHQNVMTKEQYNYVWNIGCLVQTSKYVSFVPCISYVSV